MTSNIIPLRAPQAPAVRLIERTEPAQVINLRPEFALARAHNEARRRADEAGRRLEELEQAAGEWMR